MRPRHLLDTHVLIWYLNGDKSVSLASWQVIELPEAINFVSIISLWEIAFKLSLHKLYIASPFRLINQYIDANGFKIPPVFFQDTLLVSNLPFHHRDPFDRMLAAQSLGNGPTLISKDRSFEQYNVQQIW